MFGLKARTATTHSLCSLHSLYHVFVARRFDEAKSTCEGSPKIPSARCRLNNGSKHPKAERLKNFVGVPTRPAAVDRVDGYRRYLTKVFMHHGNVQ